MRLIQLHVGPQRASRWRLPSYFGPLQLALAAQLRTTLTLACETLSFLSDRSQVDFAKQPMYECDRSLNFSACKSKRVTEVAEQ